MKIKILSIITILSLSLSSVFAHECMHENMPHKPTFKEQRYMDKLINERLNLSQEQQEQLRQNRIKHHKEMDKILKNMEEKHLEIRNVYYSGIPKFQADIKTAPIKTELVLLKQNADKLRKEHRKTFENILTQEQKEEFEKIKLELNKKK